MGYLAAVLVIFAALAIWHSCSSDIPSQAKEDARVTAIILAVIAFFIYFD